MSTEIESENKRLRKALENIVNSVVKPPVLKSDPVKDLAEISRIALKHIDDLKDIAKTALK